MSKSVAKCVTITSSYECWNYYSTWVVPLRAACPLSACSAAPSPPSTKSFAFASLYFDSWQMTFHLHILNQLTSHVILCSALILTLSHALRLFYYFRFNFFSVLLSVFFSCFSTLTPWSFWSVRAFLYVCVSRFVLMCVHFKGSSGRQGHFWTQLRDQPLWI